MFSFGVLLWELWSNYERVVGSEGVGGDWGEEQEKELAERMLRGEMPQICSSNPFASLIFKCWREKDSRPTFVELLAEYGEIMEREEKESREKSKKKKRGNSRKGSKKKRGNSRKEKGKEKK